jgi:transposase-like protein
MSQGKPRDLHKEQYWRQLIQRWQASDLSIRAFCRQHHLAIPSFYAWRRTLRERDRSAEQTPPSLTFLPIHVRDDDRPVSPPLELVFANGRCLRIPIGFDPEQLRAVLRAVEELSC